MSHPGTQGLIANAPLNAPYVLVMKNCREHSIYLEDITDDGWLIGKVAIGMTMTLSDPGDSSLGLSLDRDQEVDGKLGEKECLVRQKCVVRSPAQKVYISVSEISVIEDSSRPLVLLNDDGTLNEDLAVKAVPEIGKYRLPEGGFVANPYASHSLQIVSPSEGAEEEPVSKKD
jgi:hypothetical protein